LPICGNNSLSSKNNSSNPSGRGAEDYAPTVTLTLAHEEIAQMIGTSRETVTRRLSDFKKKELLQIKGSTLIIKNKPGLESVLSS
jgi:CRP-like cAMP-binding protein